MKVLKGIVVLFIITTVLSCVGVKADSYLGFSNIKIPKMMDTYKSDTVKKLTQSDQYLRVISTSNDRKVMAQVNNASNGTKTAYQPTANGKTTRLTTTDGVGFEKGKYTLKLKTVGWHVTKTAFWGTWYLEQYLA